MTSNCMVGFERSAAVGAMTVPTLHGELDVRLATVTHGSSALSNR
jgi:hypothetical protein